MIMPNLQSPNTETAAVIVKRTLPYPADAIYKAFTDPKIMSQWFYGGKGWTAEATNEFRIEGPFSIRMRSQQGEVIPHNGVYKEIIPGEKLAFTWNSPFAKDTLVTIGFRKVAAGTELTLTHEFLLEAETPKHKEGWGTCLDNLVAYLGASAK
jgi:uncharacterized protein YndB with AHSA1/START domain